MKIYIPEHFKKLKIIEYLVKMIEEYSENYYEGDGLDSFSDYNYYLKEDPVQKFLSSYCISEETLAEGQSLEEVIKYVTKLFYSVKGTSKVFEYIKKYFGLSISGDIIYNSDYVEITVSQVDLTDESSFITSFENFLNALLFVKDIRIQMPEVNLVLRGQIDNKIGASLVTYKIFLAKPVEL